MASGPITSWETDEETVETVSDFILGGSKITADGDCDHEIKRCLLPGRKVMTNLNSILKSRDITLLIKVCLVKAFYAEYIMRNAGLEEALAGTKIAGRNINKLRLQMIPPLWQKVKRN